MYVFMYSSCQFNWTEQVPENYKYNHNPEISSGTEPEPCNLRRNRTRTLEILKIRTRTLKIYKIRTRTLKFEPNPGSSISTYPYVS